MAKKSSTTDDMSKMMKKHMKDMPMNKKKMGPPTKKDPAPKRKK